MPWFLGPFDVGWSGQVTSLPCSATPFSWSPGAVALAGGAVPHLRIGGLTLLPSGSVLTHFGHVFHTPSGYQLPSPLGGAALRHGSILNARVRSVLTASALLLFFVAFNPKAVYFKAACD